MNQGMVNTVIGAVVGGIIGAGVVFFAGTGNTTHFKNLTVDNLTITEQAQLVTEVDGEQIPMLVIRDGSLMAENVIFARKLVGTQLQGHAIVANRVFTTPDNLFTTPMEQWRFFAEIGASSDAGGEIVVRSAAGPAVVNQATRMGALLRMGFDTENQPQIFGMQNVDRSILRVSDTLSAQQRAMLQANTQGMMAPENFNSPVQQGFNNDLMPGVHQHQQAAQPTGVVQ